MSIGIQSFQDKYIDILGRRGCDPEAIAGELSGRSFKTVSMDLIFALPGQAEDDICRDVDTAFASGANHAAIYPFIDFDFTPGNIPAMGRKEKRRLLSAICAHARAKGLRRDSIWTFSSEEDARYSSMTRDDYLGFGCSAVTLLPKSFKINTFDVESYIERVSQGRLASSLTIRFTERQRMVYWLFWRMYGMSFEASDFRVFFGKELEKEYGLEFWTAEKLGFVRRDGSRWQLTDDGAFWYHHFENYYTLSYIDRMWGLMKEEAFPKKMVLG